MKKPYYRAEDYSVYNSIGCLMRRLMNQMVPRIEVLFGRDELNFTHWIVLAILREGVVSTSADISRHLNYDSGAATRLIDQLEARGLVVRQRSKEDRRVAHLALTAEGRAMAKALTPRVVDYWNDLLGDFSHAEVDTLIELLSRLLRRLDREPPGSLPVKPAAAKHRVAS